MKKSIAISFCIAITLILSAVDLFGIQNQRKSNFSGLGLKVVAVKDGVPSVTPIPGAHWTRKFERTDAAQQDDESSRVSAVNFVYKVDGDAVRVDVSVLKTKFMNVSEPVGSYMVHLDETLSINELIKFGVAPIEISVVKVNTEITSGLPALKNVAKSLEFIRVETIDPAIQAYWVSFRNNSTSNLSEVGLDTFIGDRRGTISRPRGEHGRPLAGPGEVFRIQVRGSSAGKMTDDGYAYSRTTRMEVVFALFQDDTYEGDATEAIKAIAMRNGRRDQLATIIGILRKSLTSPEANATKAIQDLGSQVASLPVEGDGAVMRELSVKFPGQSRGSVASLMTSYAAGMNGMKRDFILDLEKFMKENGYPNFTGDFHKWLVNAKSHYQEWLDRLQ